MLACVAIEYVEGAAVKEISEEEGNYSLIPSSISVSVRSCVLVVVRVFPK